MSCSGLFDEQMTNLGGGLSMIEGVNVEITERQVIMFFEHTKLIDPEAPEPNKHTQLLFTAGQKRNYIAITGNRANLEHVRKKLTRILELYDPFLRGHGRITDPKIILEIENNLEHGLGLTKTFRWPVTNVIYVANKGRKPGDGRSDHEDASYRKSLL